MNLNPIPIAGGPAWRPASWAPSKMGQTPPSATGAPAAPQKISLFDIDGPAFSMVVDLTAMASGIALGSSFGKANSRWSTVFWAIAVVSGFKAALDASRLYR